ncbi:MAG: hypothetical protein FJ390_03145 [Verrucomicrobia bacterium]|nr:hypothetical protein [Verrucomicrobiota bacterium]
MSEQTPFSLQDADLSSLFRPAWTKEEERQHSFSSRRENEEKKEPRSFSGKKKVRKHFSREESFPKKPEPPRLAVLVGWAIQVLPEARGLDEMAKQIRKEMKAYSIFELARLLLQKPQRYHIKLSQRRGEEATSLFQCQIDETLWLSEKEAVAHAFSQYRDRYYRMERIATEPPKGVYKTIGVCGMSQTLLGPPNHHEYQNKIRRLHAERFSHIPFEVFKSRIQMSHDEALLERWKVEQSSQEIFYLLVPTIEGAEEKIGSLAEAEEHFTKTIAPSIVKKIEEEVILSSPVAWQQSAVAVRRLMEQEVESLKRFPLSFSQEVGQALIARGLSIFKAHENIVYVSIARPRSFHKGEQAVSDSVKRLLEVLKLHSTVPRPEQWKALLASRSSEQTPEEHESTLLKDLSWLLHEGYVVNYASRGFEVI